MAAGAMPSTWARVTRVFHPRPGQNWGPGCEPGLVRDRADASLEAETRAADKRHPWIGAAMAEARPLPGTEGGNG